MKEGLIQPEMPEQQEPSKRLKPIMDRAITKKYKLNHRLIKSFDSAEDIQAISDKIKYGSFSTGDKRNSSIS